MNLILLKIKIKKLNNNKKNKINWLIKKKISQKVRDK